MSADRIELRVTVFSDYICPFCYVGNARLDRLREHFDLKVNWCFTRLYHLPARFPVLPPDPGAQKTNFGGSGAWSSGSMAVSNRLSRNHSPWPVQVTRRAQPRHRLSVLHVRCTRGRGILVHVKAVLAGCQSVQIRRQQQTVIGIASDNGTDCVSDTRVGQLHHCDGYTLRARTATRTRPSRAARVSWRTSPNPDYDIVACATAGR